MVMRPGGKEGVHQMVDIIAGRVEILAADCHGVLGGHGFYSFWCSLGQIVSVHHVGN
jgi:hypothetical protein